MATIILTVFIRRTPKRGLYLWNQVRRKHCIRAVGRGRDRAVSTCMCNTYVLDMPSTNLCMLQEPEMIPCEPVPTDATASMMYRLPIVPFTSVNPESPAVSVPPHAIVLPLLASWTCVEGDR